MVVSHRLKEIGASLKQAPFAAAALVGGFAFDDAIKPCIELATTGIELKRWQAGEQLAPDFLNAIWYIIIRGPAAEGEGADFARVEIVKGIPGGFEPFAWAQPVFPVRQVPSD